MAGLACGEANTIGWEILKNHSSMFVSCPDWVAANGMRILGNPLKDDPYVISGESGAVTTGLLVEIMKNDEYRELREKLNLMKNLKYYYLAQKEIQTQINIEALYGWENAQNKIA